MSQPVPASPVESPREALRLIVTLAITGLLSGLAIVSLYHLTLPRIQANQRAALERAVFEVLPGTQRVERLSWDGKRLAPGVAGEGALEDSIFAGYDAKEALVGYAVPAAGAGFQDTLKLIYGLDPSGAQVLGMTVLESRETPGLGDKIYKDPNFIAEFRALAVEPVIELIKGHGEKANQVDAITGATISSRAVVRIINKANSIWRPRLPAPGELPPAAKGGTIVPPDAERGGPVPRGLSGAKP